MLVLGRREDDKILIKTQHGEEIRVTIVQASSKIRIGIEAPDSTQIYRDDAVETKPKKGVKDE